MKYVIIVQNEDNHILPQIDLLESLGHTVEIVEIDPFSSLIVDVDVPCGIIGPIPSTYVSWKNYNALNFFI